MGWVNYELRGLVATVTINDPPVNALTIPLLAEMGAALDQVLKSEARAVVLSGEGNAFSAGANIRWLTDNTPEANEEMFVHIYRFLNRVDNFPLPIIAAINGHCMGAGLELALCCDFRVMDERARLGATGVNLGLVFCTQRLPRLVGPGRASEMLMTGRHLSAAEAKEIGLVEHIAARGQVLTKALDMANIIATRSFPAVKGVKAAMLEGRDKPIDEALKVEEKYLHQMFRTKDFTARAQEFFKGGM
ncbi:MAG: enoyl-CoA hydratase/isomerase family protein [Methylocystaceae bacterium]